MYLTREEESMLDGGLGPAVAKSMKLLVTLGEVFEADRLVSVDSAHISGVSYKNLGESGLEFLEDQAKLGAKVRIKSTLNPAGMDLDLWDEMGVSDDFACGQLRAIKAFENMGIELTCTCTPYLVGHIPKPSTQVAWAESSAVAYSNSVLGARTNRESGPTTIASAVTGLTALYGYRLDENRRPGKIVEVKSDLRNRLDYSALGYLTGTLLGTTVPFFKGIKNPDIESLKALGASCATSGGIALYYIEGVTPEAVNVSSSLMGLEKITIEDSDLENVISKLTSGSEDPVFCLGCPHCSLKEIKESVNAIKDKKVTRNLWIFTSRGVYNEADKRGYIDVIREAGGRVYKDTCMVVAPLKEMGWSEVATNSLKCAHYLSSMGFKTQVEPAELMLESSCR